MRLGRSLLKLTDALSLGANLTPIMKVCVYVVFFFCKPKKIKHNIHPLLKTCMVLNGNYVLFPLNRFSSFCDASIKQSH